MDKTTIGQLTVWNHPAKDDEKARVLLVHGVGEHSARHLNTVNFLNAHCISVVRFDLRGMGESQGRRQWVDSFDDYVQDTLSVLNWTKESLEPLPLFLLGHSLGGAISLHFAAQHANSLKGLILSAPAFKVGKRVPKVVIKVARALSKHLPKLRMPGTLDTTAISRDTAVIKAYKKDPLACHFNTLRQGDEILRALDVIPSLYPKISLPLLIAHGSEDRIIKIEGSKEILEKVASKDKTLYIHPDGYHELHNDFEKEKYFTELADWVNTRC